MLVDEIKFSYFWRPDWCPFKKNCRPKALSRNKDICFGADSTFRICIDFGAEALDQFYETHDPDSSAVAFVSLTRKELITFRDMIDAALKYSAGVDPVEKVNMHDKYWKTESKPIAGK